MFARSALPLFAALVVGLLVAGHGCRRSPPPAPAARAEAEPASAVSTVGEKAPRVPVTTGRSVLEADAPVGPPLASPAPRAAQPMPIGHCRDYAPARQVARLRIDALPEASGLVASRRQPRVLFTHNDSGNPPIVFAVRTDGLSLGSWRLAPARNIDWEDMALGPCAPGASDSCLYVADTGDNYARRARGVQIYVAREPEVPDVAREGLLPVERTIHLRFPDGPRDCEAVLVHPTSADIYLIAKRPRKDGHPGRGVYLLRAGLTGTAAAPVVVQRLGFLDPPPGDGLFTAGDVHPAGDRVVLRGYQSVLEYRLPPGLPFAEIFRQRPRVLPGLGPRGGRERQGEAVAYSADGLAIYTTSEGNRPPLNRRDCREAAATPPRDGIRP